MILFTHDREWLSRQFFEMQPIVREELTDAMKDRYLELVIPLYAVCINGIDAQAEAMSTVKEEFRLTFIDPSDTINL